MGRILYWDCSSGFSGDMAVASLLDLGADGDAVKEALESIEVEGFGIEVSRVMKSGIDICDFSVILDQAHENHDHDMAYLYGPWHEDDDSHHPHEHHSHEHHSHGHHSHKDHSHEHRGLQEIIAIIDAATMNPEAKALATEIFTILAEAESKAHNVPIEEVHFHEVGAIDSIADIIAFSVAFDSLAVEEVATSPLSEGSGFVRCQHGLIPVPVPAVANIASSYGLPLRFIPVEGELVTPTGAAIVAATRTLEALPDSVIVKRVGMGNGKRHYETPGILRAILLETPSA